jgi:hypothetical protein
VPQVLSDCLIPLSAVRSQLVDLSIWGAARTFPIRVANRFNAEGQMIGWSGPCYPDQRELDWKEDLGMEPELTTVTKLPRRIFSFSMHQLLDSVRANDVNKIFMNFMNYLNKEDAVKFMANLKRNGMYPTLVGVGATIDDVKFIGNNDPETWGIPF